MLPCSGNTAGRGHQGDDGDCHQRNAVDLTSAQLKQESLSARAVETGRLFWLLDLGVSLTSGPVV